MNLYMPSQTLLRFYYSERYFYRVESGAIIVGPESRRDKEHLEVEGNVSDVVLRIRELAS